MPKDELAKALVEVADEVRDWAAGRGNGGPFSEEIYRTNCQISGMLNLLASKVAGKTEGVTMPKDERSELVEREAVVKWLRDTAATAAKCWSGDDERSVEIRRQLVGTLLVNADAIGRGEHRKPPHARG